MRKIKHAVFGTTISLGIVISGFAGATAAQAAPVQVNHSPVSISAAKKISVVKMKTTNRVNIRAGASTRTKIIKTVNKGIIVNSIGTLGGWKKIKMQNGKTAWISSGYLTRYTPVKAKPKSKVTINVASSTLTRTKVIKNARNNLGKKYRFGGTSPSTGWDCSGYVQYVFKKSGVGLPRTKAWVGKKKISKSQAKPGDLVVQYNGGHVGIYAGNGKQYHAANPKSGTIYSTIVSPTQVYYNVLK